MSDDELVKRLQVGHDPHCAMSYGMHEHCCDCSYPCRQEAVETINKLRQDLAAARARVEKLEGAEEDRDEYQRQAKLYAERCAESDMELAAARTLLREVREWIPYYRWIPDLRNRIDAAIAGEKK